MGEIYKPSAEDERKAEERMSDPERHASTRRNDAIEELERRGGRGHLEFRREVISDDELKAEGWPDYVKGVFRIWGEVDGQKLVLRVGRIESGAYPGALETIATGDTESERYRGTIEGREIPNWVAKEFFERYVGEVGNLSDGGAIDRDLEDNIAKKVSEDLRVSNKTSERSSSR